MPDMNDKIDDKIVKLPQARGEAAKRRLNSDKKISVRRRNIL
jgi:hypothetical protein